MLVETKTIIPKDRLRGKLVSTAPIHKYILVPLPTENCEKKE